MTYALGRGVEPSDMPVVRTIVRQVAPKNYALQSIVIGIVESAPFQMRTKLEPGSDTNPKERRQGVPADSSDKVARREQP